MGSMRYRCLYDAHMVALLGGALVAERQVRGVRVNGMERGVDFFIVILVTQTKKIAITLPRA